MTNHVGYWRDRVDANKRLPCEVRGCPRTRTAGARWCNRHRLRDARFGSPEAFALPRRRLASLSKIASKFLTANSGHPAVTLARRDLDAMLAEGAAHVAARDAWWKPAERDVTGKTAVELKRLHDAGATSLDLLRAALTVHLTACLPPALLERATPEYRHALARAVLMAKPLNKRMILTSRYKPRRIYSRLSTRVLRSLGKTLAVKLCVVLDAMARAIEQQQKAHST